MADEYVLASKIETSEPDENSVTGVSPKVLAERGDSLPSELEDQRDQLIEDGVLVKKDMLPVEPPPEIQSTSLAEQQALAAVLQVEEDEGGETEATAEVKQALGVPTDEERQQAEEAQAKAEKTQTKAEDKRAEPAKPTQAGKANP